MLFLLLCLLGFFLQSDGLMFHSQAVTKEWDTWVFVENNTYYAYYLVTEVSAHEHPTCIADDCISVCVYCIKKKNTEERSAIKEVAVRKCVPVRFSDHVHAAHDDLNPGGGAVHGLYPR